MKMKQANRLSWALVCLLIAGLAACGDDGGGDASGPAQQPSDACPSGKCDGANGANAFEHKWAVDMAKVNAQYGPTTSLFFWSRRPRERTASASRRGGRLGSDVLPES